MSVLLKRPSVLPGFGLTLGFSIFYLSVIVLIPLSGLFVKTSTLSWGQFWETITTGRAIASYQLTFGASLIGALINGLFGSIIAWVLVRYRFPGRALIDALVDLPFALPTAVAGITLAAIYASNGWLGRYLDLFGIKVAFTPLGVLVALTFIGLPFVVRTVQPVLQDIDKEVEEAATTLGANRWQTFVAVIVPELWPALLTGIAMAFARAVGEYGSVIFIAGNMPLKSEITPLLIMTKLEQYDYTGATALGVVMLAVSFVLALAINLLQWWSSARHMNQ
jgi:sulfate transport system permease protein